ncbi:hypothetical protein GCM10023166_15700 [Paeniglutamicibacter cryotolerans]
MIQLFVDDCERGVGSRVPVAEQFRDYHLVGESGLYGEWGNRHVITLVRDSVCVGVRTGAGTVPLKLSGPVPAARHHEALTKRRPAAYLPRRPNSSEAMTVPAVTV